MTVQLATEGAASVSTNSLVPRIQVLSLFRQKASPLELNHEVCHFLAKISI